MWVNPTHEINENECPTNINETTVCINITGDLLAHEITMGDNDRIALMQMVKEGKISTDTALQVVSMVYYMVSQCAGYVIDLYKLFSGWYICK